MPGRAAFQAMDQTVDIEGLAFYAYSLVVESAAVLLHEQRVALGFVKVNIDCGPGA